MLLQAQEEAHTGSETVGLKDVTPIYQNDKRTLSDLDLPDELTLYLRRGSGALTLNLKRNHEINPKADVYFVRKLKVGRSFLAKERNFEKEAVGYYQDRGNGAFMTVRCVERSNEQCDRVIPAKTDDTSINLLEVPGLLGKRYVLQDVANIQREHLVKNKDAGKVNEKYVEQELLDLLRRFQHGQHKLSHSPRPDATVSPRKLADLNNTGVTDKTRNLNKVYYVEVAVLIDLGTWELYSSTVQNSFLQRRNKLVKRKIKEAFSHIINGVNLRYKEIGDTSISISITLRSFIYFKRQDLFPHKISSVKIVNNKIHIDAYDYIHDLTNWETLKGSKHIADYDHAMLFTRYDLYEDNLSDNSIVGLSFRGDVCNLGSRLSIVELHDYASTVSTAAHELGHNLGAYHDGDPKGNATACKPEDLFIMTPDTLDVGLGVQYSRNPWIFPTYSVESFKQTLKDKQCVTNKGVFYNEQKWMKYTMKQPGEVYDPNEQCHHINGPKSRYCGTSLADICNLMRCTDGITGKCIPTYFSAARGTRCGENRATIAACHTQPCMNMEMLQDFQVQTSILGYENRLCIFGRTAPFKTHFRIKYNYPGVY